MATAARIGSEAPAPSRRRSGSAARYWPGLDGMRALAVVAVVVYHIAPGVLPGGFLGVDVFFVISGYLITTLLVDGWKRHGLPGPSRQGRGDLLQFWKRRVRRLYPAVVALLVVLVPVTAIWDPGALAASRLTIVAALVYLTNWWFIFHHVSYFQSFGPPPLLLHLWSLAIEEQYYLIWPIVLFVVLRRGRRPAQVAVLAAGGAVVSAALMALLYHGTGSVNRVYYGSDTHAQGLLIGSALGLSVPPTGFPASITSGARRILDRLGLGSILGVIALMIVLNEDDTFTWRGGLDLAVLLSAVAVVVAAHPATTCSRWLACRPLRWLGTRSYSIYLWHWPVIVLTERGGVLPLGGLDCLCARVAAIAAAAEGSYRLVERPWRTGAAQRALRRLKRSPRALWASVATAGAGAGSLAVVVALVAAPVLPEATGPSSTPASHVHLSSSPGGPASLPNGPRTVRPEPAGGPPARTGPSAPSSGPPAPSSTAPLSPKAGGPVLAIGDSVMLGASVDLEKDFGSKITVDAVVGRQVYTGLDRIAEYRSAGRLRGLRALVVGLGSNGPFTPSDLVELRHLAVGVPRVVLVNVRVPDPWQSESNRTIDSATRYRGYVVVNWYAASSAPGVLYPDGVHPDPAGQELYARLVVKAVTGYQRVVTVTDRT